MDILLKSLKGEAFASIFSDLKFGEESLKSLSWEQFRMEISKELVGQAVVFFNELQNWKRHNNYLSDQGKAPGINGSEIDLATILANSNQAAAVINYFKETGRLTNEFRKVLSGIIAEHFVYNNIQTNQIVLNQIADEIQELFESEIKETYFIKNFGKKPGGLLYSKIYNLKAKAKKQSAVQLSGTSNDENTCPNPTDLNDDKVITCKQWLMFNIEPRREVDEKWDLTFEWRQSFLSTTATLSAILEEFPILKQAFGHELIVADYQKIHSKDSDTFVAKWQEFKSVALSLFLSKIKEVQSINLLKTFSNQSEDTKDAVLLHVIHSVLIPTKRGKRGSSGNLKLKYTIQDSRDHFIIFKSSVGELQSHLKVLTDENYKIKQPLQPIICCIGSSLYNFEKYFVYISGIFYELPNILKSVEICFKIFIVLNLKYPDPCCLVWTFIQQHFFDLNLKSDLKNRILSELLNDLKNTSISNLS
ncbi:uncharacterized protein [Drosophila takahashii]|uniref:uncharacterized protein isoform X1 n=1 Tax=Drosophila takahashii TaxID=29030 RepID=UPI0038990CFB